MVPTYPLANPAGMVSPGHSPEVQLSGDRVPAHGGSNEAGIDKYGRVDGSGASAP